MQHLLVHNCNIFWLLSAAVRRNKLHSGATLNEVETVSKLWLRYAADRYGGGGCQKSRQSAGRNRRDTESDTDRQQSLCWD